jgi:hypothetical protein
MDDFSEVFDRVPPLISLAALIGLFLLLPLYLSQRRDVLRLRAWMAREPDHPQTDVAASEAILDHAETELEELLGESPVADTVVQPTPAGGITPAGGVTPAGGSSAATRVTSERPALERITMERAALVPHPRWRRFVSRATQPRVLVAIAVAAIVLGVGGIFVSEQLLSEDEPQGTKVGAIDRADVTVAVLNGTAVNGLAGKVGADVESNGYQLGAVGGTEPGFEKSVVLFADGQKAAAQKVARDLGLDERKVERLNRATRAEAADPESGEPPNVVVIAGEDRAQS